ncbi:hypothetical protein [Mycobacterium uberis]|nr:hypothetical protein [Mycobacterium uberis]
MSTAVLMTNVKGDLFGLTWSGGDQR